MTIRTTDHGTWRRIKTYKFKIVFKQDPDENDPLEKELDPQVAELFSQDARYKEAFLSILVEYYRKLQNEYGGNVLNISSPTIDFETNLYRQNEDIVSAFLDSRCVISPNNSQAILDIVELYKTWIIDNIGNSLTSNNQQISNIILNSKICKYFKIEDKLYVLKGHRILDKNDQVTKNERYLNE
jgi:phage/plasmid-associated DNA primase